MTLRTAQLMYIQASPLKFISGSPAITREFGESFIAFLVSITSEFHSYKPQEESICIGLYTAKDAIV